MRSRPKSQRPHITGVLAMSADGKIADAQRSAARFPSAADKAHLENQIAQADATLFGAGTLRAYGTTLPVTNLDLIAARQQRQQFDQPVQIVCSATGKLDRQWRFFQQPIPRWLITTSAGLLTWQSSQPAIAQTISAPDPPDLFDQILVTECPFDWSALMQSLRAGQSTLTPKNYSPPIHRPIHRLVVMGGGALMADLLAHHLIDDLYITVCPLIIGGTAAPTPVDGLGFTLPNTPRLKLKSARTEGDEVFLHYITTKIAPVLNEQNGGN